MRRQIGLSRLLLQACQHENHKYNLAADKLVHVVVPIDLVFV